MIKHAYAKINLILQIIGKRDDGFHELRSLMIPIDYYDTLEFELADDISLTSNMNIEQNAILKVAYFMKETFRVNQGVKIKLDKRIPVGSGLAGGSANISKTIEALNELWALNLKKETLESIANRFGSDTLFQLYQKPAIISGRGDQIKFVDIPKINRILLIIPDVEILTKDVFKHFDKTQNNDFDEALNKVNQKDYQYLFNDLLKPALMTSKKLNVLYEDLVKRDLKVHLSGSGSTLFIIEPDQMTIDYLKTRQDITMILTKQL